MYDTDKELNKLGTQYMSRKAKAIFQSPDKQTAEALCCVFSPGLQSLSDHSFLVKDTLFHAQIYSLSNTGRAFVD